MKFAIKRYLRKLGISEFLYYVDASIKKTYELQKISYKGVEFSMYGLGGDFKQSVQLYGAYEPLLMDKVVEIVKKDDVVFDIGCAEGFFSLFVSFLNHAPQNIHAFDASTARARIFKKNFKRAYKTKKDYVYGFVSDNDEIEDNLTIDKYIIDYKVIDPIKLIKIDVEGAEIKILQGMKRCLLDKKPNLLIEIHPGKIELFDSSISTLIDIIFGSNYKVDLSSNHRGKHRGQVEPWKTVNEKELITFYNETLKTNPHNFAIHAYRKI